MQLGAALLLGQRAHAAAPGVLWRLYGARLAPLAHARVPPPTHTCTRPTPQEFYGDFMALDSHHFVVPACTHSHTTTHPRCPPQEFYGDFMALDAHHFVVPAAGADVLINPRAALASGGPSE